MNRLDWGGVVSGIWSAYIRALKLGHFRITKREDELVWKHKPHGVYTPKAGYHKLALTFSTKTPLGGGKGCEK